MTDDERRMAELRSAAIAHVVEIRHTFRAWLYDAAKKFAIDLAVQAFWGAWRGAAFAAGAAFTAVGVVQTVAASPAVSAWVVPPEVADTLDVLRAAAIKYLSE